MLKTPARTPFSLFVLVLLCLPGSDTRAQSTSSVGWFFAVSGDSRDCGDLIMPKIAQAIESNKAAAPVEFYWHLGDLRRMYDIDCDVVTRTHPNYDCKTRRDPLNLNEMNDYLNTAWEDFIQHQIQPFNQTPFFLGIGNHELMANRTREDIRRTFQKWLTQEPLHAQRMADADTGLYTNEGDTTYHFVRKGVDFINLDNADANSFIASQITWLAKVLANDANDANVKTIVVGMHAALPFSKSRNHAMDSSCQGICSGQQVYDMLYRAQNFTGPLENMKHVYVLASHSHYFMENIYDTPEHQGQVLPGWIVGTAGAEQYTDTIQYGYLKVEVRPDGTLNGVFKTVTADSPLKATGPGADTLTKFCFEANKRPGGSNDAVKGVCPCGAAR